MCVCERERVCVCVRERERERERERNSACRYVCVYKSFLVPDIKPRLARAYNRSI